MITMDEYRNNIEGRLGYNTVHVARTNGIMPVSASGQKHGEYDRQHMVSLAREFYRDNVLFKGMIDRAVSYIIGEGFQLQARTSDVEWNRQAEKLWREFWTAPDIRGMLSGRAIEAQICREVLTAGDTGIIKTQYGLIQHIESEQITSANNRDGVEVTDVGRPVLYHVSPYHNGYVNTGAAVSVDAENMIFLAALDRPSSTRGVPPAQTSFTMLLRIMDVIDSEALAWQIMSRIAVAITRKNGPDMAAMETTEGGLSEEERAGFNTRTRDFGGMHAIVFEGEEGDEIKGVDQNRPAQNFMESLTGFLRLMGLSLGLPIEVILLDWTKSNYSQSRAVLEQAFKTFGEWQSMLEEGFYRKVYQWKVQEWMDSGILDDNEEWKKHEWIKPSWPWLDQLKEAQAYALKLKYGFTTHAAVSKQLGRERDDVVKVRQQEIMSAIAAAKEIQDKTGITVPWQTFAGLDVSDTPSTIPEEDEDQ